MQKKRANFLSRGGSSLMLLSNSSRVSIGGGREGIWGIGGHCVPLRATKSH
jgi:hypothetical protein